MNLFHYLKNYPELPIIQRIKIWGIIEHDDCYKPCIIYLYYKKMCMCKKGIKPSLCKTCWWLL